MTDMSRNRAARRFPAASELLMWNILLESLLENMDYIETEELENDVRIENISGHFGDQLAVERTEKSRLEWWKDIYGILKTKKFFGFTKLAFVGFGCFIILCCFFLYNYYTSIFAK
ncbi:hypothetical protein JTB14_004037 [Gonioctena quinquepunctata]|nr:hypothetical protein JTB14_004037 [Gonioctena quinquepunctata]